MNRRQFLSALGTGAVGVTLSTGGSWATSERNNHDVGTLPNRDVPTEIVTPYADSNVGNPAVPAGSWIIHRFGWQTVADEGPDTLQQFRDAAEYDFRIDGESVETQTPFWNEIQEVEAGDDWYLRWEYATPPKPPGLYEFSVHMSFDHPLRYPDGTGETKLWKGEVVESSTYDVVAVDETTPSLPIAIDTRKTAVAARIADHTWNGEPLTHGGHTPGRWYDPGESVLGHGRRKHQSAREDE